MDILILFHHHCHGRMPIIFLPFIIWFIYLMTVMIKFVMVQDYKSKTEFALDLFIPFWLWIRHLYSSFNELGK